MLRWTLISIVSAVAFLTVELVVLNTVCGRDKDKGSDRGRSSDAGGRSSSDGGDGGRSLSGGGSGSRKSESRSFAPRNVQPRNFDSGDLDSKKLKSSDSTPRIQPQPNSQIENFRRSTGDTKKLNADRSKDTPRFDVPRTPGGDAGNLLGAEAIRKAHEKLGKRGGESKKPGNDLEIEPRKLSDPNVDNPSSTRDLKGSGLRDRIKRTDSVKQDDQLDGKIDKLPKQARDALDRAKLPKQARDALDRAEVKRDLKLGDHDRDDFKKDSKDILGNADVDDKKFDGKGLPKNFDRGDVINREPKISDRKRELEDRLGIDESNRDKYDMLHHRIKHDGRLDDVTVAKLAKQNWLEKGDRDHFEKLARSSKLQKYRLDEQYHLHDNGDIARRLDLHDDLERRGGWQHRHVGRIDHHYRNHCAFRSYWGPSWYPRRCWYPVWGSWVSWSWGFHCDPWFDPRPIFCRPVIYDPCPRWVVWQYPVWQPLPVVAAGTWVDVPQIVVDRGWDVQLLAVRFVDPGHLEQNLGSSYRVWLRNNSRTDVNQAFNVVLMGVDGLLPNDRRVEVGQRVPSLAAGQTLAIDLRLPLMPDGRAGEPFAFSNVHVLVDANRELRDTELTNNGAVIDRGDIQPVDPATFNADSDIVEPGMVINVAGEGLGPEPGQVMLQVGNDTYQPEILGWYDLGVQVRVPEVAAAGLASGDLVIIRGDGAAANPLTLQIAGAEVAGRAF